MRHFIMAMSGLLFASALGAQSEGGLVTGELGIIGAGLRPEGGTRWTGAYNVGYAHNAFKNPQLPLLFEVNGAVDRSSSENTSSASSIDYFGGGLRFGGGRYGLSPYGLATAGFAKFRSVTVVSIGNQARRSESTFTKAGISVGGGVNLDITRSWGARVEIRGLKIQDLQPWLYQAGGGIYYRFGK